MTIPAPQNTQILAIRADLAAAEAAMAKLVSDGDAMMTVAYLAGNQALVNLTLRHRARARELQAAIELWHSDLTDDLIALYGAPDGRPVILGGSR